jgi:hypothetical protein
MGTRPENDDLGRARVRRLLETFQTAHKEAEVFVFSGVDSDHPLVPKCAVEDIDKR